MGSEYQVKIGYHETRGRKKYRHRWTYGVRLLKITLELDHIWSHSSLSFNQHLLCCTKQIYRKVFMCMWPMCEIGGKEDLVTLYQTTKAKALDLPLSLYVALFLSRLIIALLALHVLFETQFPHLSIAP